jgi:hypothetical protein
MEKAKVEIWDMHEPIKEQNVMVLTVNESEKFNENIENEIDLIWQTKKGTENPLINLFGYQNRSYDNKILMDVKKGSFKYHVVLNKIDKIPEELSGKIKSTISDFRKLAVENDQLVLTAMALLYTKDNKVVFTEKSEGGITTGKYSVIPAGYTHPIYDADTSRKPSTNKTIRREFWEELGVENESIKELYNTGLLFSDSQNRGFSLTYLMKLNLRFKELEELYKEKHDAETKRIMPVDFSRKGLQNFLDQYISGFTNNGLGCLLVSGKAYLGDKWFDKTFEYAQEKYGRMDINILEKNITHSINDILKDRVY